MSYKAYKTVDKRRTSQKEAIPGQEHKQAENSAGGYVYKLDKWKQLDRFLILGSSGSTYYASAEKLTKDNAKIVEACLKDDYQRVIDRTVEVSQRGLAPKNDPAIFVLALAASDEPECRKAALRELSQVCRIPTHLFHFVDFLKGMRGWGSGLRKAIGAWYDAMPSDKLAYELVKYQSRDGWSNRDLLRKAHPTAKSPEQDAVYRWAIGASLDDRVVPDKSGMKKRSYGAVREALPKIIWGFEEAKKVTEVKDWIPLIQEFGLTREMLPTEALKHREVWEALLEKMPLGAMVRNLGNMSKVGLLVNRSEASKKVCSQLLNLDALKKARIHPMNLLVAMKTYEAGRGLKGSGTWEAARDVVDTLDESFYLSFEAVEPTGKSFLLALDISGSMTWGNIGDMPITPREASAVLALVTMKVEKDCEVVGFTSTGSRPSMHFGYSSGISRLKISARQRLDDVLKEIAKYPMGGTDCALPAIWAKEEKLKFDAISIYTDNETWAGNVHPSQALKAYRDQFGPCRQVVIGMTSTGFTIADPEDPLSLDVAGFSSDTPKVISEFSAGKF